MPSEGLLERDRELDRLDALLAATASGSGGLLVLEGPAGIGKTRLLTAARERGTAAGLQVLAARAGELERDWPFGVVRQLLEGAVHGRELTGAAAAARVV